MYKCPYIDLSIYCYRNAAFSRFGELVEAVVMMERDNASKSRGFGNQLLSTPTYNVPKIVFYFQYVFVYCQCYNILFFFLFKVL
jgi:hypothetical protein